MGLAREHIVNNPWDDLTDVGLKGYNSATKKLEITTTANQDPLICMLAHCSFTPNSQDL